MRLHSACLFPTSHWTFPLRRSDVRGPGGCSQTDAVTARQIIDARFMQASSMIRGLLGCLLGCEIGFPMPRRSVDKYVGLGTASSLPDGGGLVVNDDERRESRLFPIPYDIDEASHPVSDTGQGRRTTRCGVCSEYVLTAGTILACIGCTGPAVEECRAVSDLASRSRPQHRKAQISQENTGGIGNCLARYSAGDGEGAENQM